VRAVVEVSEPTRAERVAALEQLYRRGRLVVAYDAAELVRAARRGRAFDSRGVAEALLAAGGLEAQAPAVAPPQRLAA